MNPQTPFLNNDVSVSFGIGNSCVLCTIKLASVWLRFGKCGIPVLVCKGALLSIASMRPGAFTKFTSPNNRSQKNKSRTCKQKHNQSIWSIAPWCTPHATTHKHTQPRHDTANTKHDNVCSIHALWVNCAFRCWNANFKKKKKTDLYGKCLASLTKDLAKHLTRPGQTLGQPWQRT